MHLLLMLLLLLPQRLHPLPLGCHVEGSSAPHLLLLLLPLNPLRLGCHSHTQVPTLLLLRRRRLHVLHLGCHTQTQEPPPVHSLPLLLLLLLLLLHPARDGLLQLRPLLGPLQPREGSPYCARSHMHAHSTCGHQSQPGGACQGRPESWGQG
jgi:hypothetical protein